MITTGARWTAVAGLAIGALVVSGCTDEPHSEGRETTPTDSHPSASENTSTPTAPPLPPEAAALDASGASSFARHWYGLADHAYSTGDVAPLREASDPECQFCNSLITAIEATTREGKRITGGHATVHSAEAQEPDETGTSLVSVVLSQEPVLIADSGSTTTEEPAIERVPIEFYANVFEGRWIAVGMR